MRTLDATIRHLIFGGDHPADPPVPLSNIREDAGFNDPNQAGGTDGNFESQSADAIQEANLTEAMGLASGDGGLGQAAVDMDTANSNRPAMPSANYGPGNSGR